MHSSAMSRDYPTQWRVTSSLPNGDGYFLKKECSGGCNILKVEKVYTTLIEINQI